MEAEPAAGRPRRGRKLLILVPTLNEAGNVEQAVRGIVAALPEGDILVIDDNSADGTQSAVESLRAEFGQVRLLVRCGPRRGLGRAVRDGYRYALDNGYDEVCVVDCDLQQDPADVARMRACGAGAGVVVGSRYRRPAGFARGYPGASKWLSLLGNAVLRLVFQIPCRDATTDFYLLDTRVLRHIRPEALRSRGYALFFELKLRAWRAGFRLAEVAVPTRQRHVGASHRDWRQFWLFAKEVGRVWASFLPRFRAPTSGRRVHGPG